MTRVLIAIILLASAASIGAAGYSRPPVVNQYVSNTNVTNITDRPAYCYKTENQITYGNGKVDVVDIGFSVVENSTYSFEVYVIFKTTATTDGALFDFTAPAGLQKVTYTRETQIVAGNSTDGFASRALIAFGSDAASTAVNPANGTHISRLQGMVYTGANAGTLQLQAAGETATAKLTILAGSYARMTKW